MSAPIRKPGLLVQARNVACVKGYRERGSGKSYTVPVQQTKRLQMDCYRLVLTITLAFSTSALGQVYKCAGADGRTQYSDRPCPDGGGVVFDRPGATHEVLEPSSPSTYRPGPHEQQLTARIYEALAQKDYRRAESLAVTERQWQIINEAKASDAAEKQARSAERRANRPIVCTNSGYQIGGSYLGQTVCR